MKNIVLLTALTAVLTGCAGYQQQGAGIGAVAGAIIGNQVGGGLGQVAATAIGAAVGSNVGANVGAHMDQHRNNGGAPVMQQQQYYQQQYYQPDYSVCNQYQRWSERESCRRGVDRAFKVQQQKRSNDAYDAGYRSNQGYN